MAAPTAAKPPDPLEEHGEAADDVGKQESGSQPPADGVALPVPGEQDSALPSEVQDASMKGDTEAPKEEAAGTPTQVASQQGPPQPAPALDTLESICWARKGSTVQLGEARFEVQEIGETEVVLKGVGGTIQHTLLDLFRKNYQLVSQAADIGTILSSGDSFYEVQAYENQEVILKGIKGDTLRLPITSFQDDFTIVARRENIKKSDTGAIMLGGIEFFCLFWGVLPAL